MIRRWSRAFLGWGKLIVGTLKHFRYHTRQCSRTCGCKQCSNILDQLSMVNSVPNKLWTVLPDWRQNENASRQTNGWNEFAHGLLHGKWRVYQFLFSQERRHDQWKEKNCQLWTCQTNYRRKFRSQTSDNRDGKAEVGRVREEKSRSEIREEKGWEARRCRCAKR